MVLSRAREKGLEADELVALGEQRAGCRRSSPPGLFLAQLPRQPRRPVGHRLRRPDPPRGHRGDGPPRRAARGSSGTCSSTSTRTPTPARSPCSARSPATAATWSWWATRTSRSTGSAAPRCAASSSSPPTSRGPTARPRRWCRCGPPARFGPRLLVADPAGRRPHRAARHASTPSAREAFLAPVAARTARRRAGRACAPSTPSAPRPSTSPTCSAGPTSRTASRGTGWPCWCAPAAPASRRCAARSAPPASRSRWPATSCRWSGPVRAARCSTRCGRRSTSTTTTTTHADHVDHAPRRVAAARAARRPRRRRRTPPRAAAARPREGRRARRRSRLPLTSERAGPPGRARATATSTGSRAPRSAGRARRAQLVRSTRRRPGRRRHRPRTPCGRCGPAPTGRPGCGVRSSSAAARPARAHRDLDSVFALFDVAAREAEKRDVAAVPGRPASATSCRGWSPSRSPPTRWPSRACAAPPSACSPPTASKGLEWRPRRGRPRAAGRLARPAPPLHAAPGRPDRHRRRGWGVSRRPPPASCCRRSAGSSTSRARAPASRLVVTAVASAEDDGEQPSRFLAELGVTVEKVEGRPARPLSLARPRQRAAAHRRRPGDDRDAAARRGGPPAGPTGRRDGRRPRARAAGRPVVVVGHPRRDPVGPAGPRPRRSRCRCRPACSRRSWPARPSGSSTTRGRRAPPGPPVGQPRRSSCTRSPSGSPSGEVRCPTSTSLMEHVDEVWGRLHFRTPWSASPRARPGRGRADPLPRVAPRQPAQAGRHRGEVRDRGRARRAASRCGSPATPTGSSSTPTAGSWSSTSRPTRTSPPAAASSATSSSASTSTPSTTAPSTTWRAPTARRVPAAPSSSSSACPTATRPLVQQQPAYADDGPERTALRAQLERAAALVRAETFPAVAGDHCRDCDFVPICPIKGAGSVTPR